MIFFHFYIGPVLITWLARTRQFNHRRTCTARVTVLGLCVCQSYGVPPVGQSLHGHRASSRGSQVVTSQKVVPLLAMECFRGHVILHSGVQLSTRCYMVLCIVFGCSKHSGRDKDVSFFRIPKVITNKGKDQEKLSLKRREGLLAAVMRSDLTEKNYIK